MQCLVSSDPLEIIRTERSLTVEKCLSAPLLYNQRRNEAELIKAIYLLIYRFCNLINVGKNLNETQQIQLAADLFTAFGGESLEDVALFFKMAREGAFGDFYRLDTVIINSWIPKYLDIKAEAREREIRNRENIRQRKESEIVPTEEARKRLGELAKKLTTKEEKRQSLKGHPLFDYQAYLVNLQEAVKNMSTKDLKEMMQKTSRLSHPEVLEILQAEMNTRKTKAKNIL